MAGKLQVELQSGDRFLVSIGDTKDPRRRGHVVNLGTKRVFEEAYVGSLLAHSPYWDSISDDEGAIEALKLVEVYRLQREKYVIKRPTATNNQVNAWSVQYISFEPKDWRRTMREELKLAINELEGNCLYAAYVSESDLLCDVENVLLYNVGASAFKTLSKNGLCFERGFGSTSFPSPDNLSVSHFYHYSQGNTFRLWKENEALAFWREIALPTPTSTSKPHLFWHALKNGKVTCSYKEVPLKQFGLDIQLHIPNTSWCNLAVLVKPLLDGVISAFHQQSIPCESIVLQRLSALTDSSLAETKRLLYEVVYPVLEARPIISAFRQGIIWNPGDDACVACRVKVQRSVDNESWSMNGRLFSVADNVDVDAAASRVLTKHIMDF